jgi:hypothetical protein
MFCRMCDVMLDGSRQAKDLGVYGMGLLTVCQISEMLLPSLVRWFGHVNLLAGERPASAEVILTIYAA